LQSFSTPSSSLKSSTDGLTASTPSEATKISKPKKNSKKKKTSPQQTNSTFPKAPKVGSNRVPLSTIYDSNSNQTIKAEYKPVLKNITNRPTTAEEKVLNQITKPSPIEKKRSVIKPKPFSPPSRLYSQSTPTSASPLSPPQTPLSTPIPLPVESPSSEQTHSTPVPIQTQSPVIKPLPTCSPLRTSSNRTPRKSPTQIYQKKDLYALRNLPLCSVPHPGKSPSQIIEEYNLQYAEQEKEYLKMLEDEPNLQLLFKSPQSNDFNLFTDSPLTLTSTPITPMQNNGGNCNSCPNTPNNTNYTHLTPTKNRNKKAWIPKNLAAEFSGDVVETRNIDCQNSPAQKNFADYKNNNSPQQFSPKKLANNENSSKPARNNNQSYYNSPKNNYKVILSADYKESDQEENSDEELDCEYPEPYFAIQEISAKRLESRQKQIDIGKNTPGYKNYIRLIKKEQRSYSEPQTPDKYQICSKRSWDGQIRVWRRLLHHYDPISPSITSPLGST